MKKKGVTTDQVDEEKGVGEDKIAGEETPGDEGEGGENENENEKLKSKKKKNTRDGCCQKFCDCLKKIFCC